MLNELHGAELHGVLERALRRYVRAELLVIDDFAVLAMDAAQAKLAFQVISERYEYRRSTCITTNRALQGLDEGLPRRAQRPGHRRATHRARRTLRARERLPTRATVTASRPQRERITPQAPPPASAFDHARLALASGNAKNQVHISGRLHGHR